MEPSSLVPWPWPEAPPLVVGCMRLSTDPEADEANARATLEAALEGGVRVFDTARAYGANEALVASVVRGRADVRLITKGGMRRDGAAWIPDGRARPLSEDCEASLEALGGLPIDLYLLHAPDPRTPWATSVRALKALLDAGLVRRVGVSNVNRAQLDEARALVEVSAVQVALGLGDDAPLRGGVVERCAQERILVLAHSPLGGPARAPRLLKAPRLVAAASELCRTPAQTALLALRAVHDCVVPVVGVRRPQTARECASVAAQTAEGDTRMRLAALFPPLARARSAVRPGAAECVLLMGIQGAGKSEAAKAWADRGYERFNRDERGGTLRQLNLAVAERLKAGAKQLLLDNTYLTRAARRDVLELADRHGAAVRCQFFDTPAREAQVNIVLRMLQRFGRLLTPEELRRARDAFGVAPGPHFASVRQLEHPSEDEGFASIDLIPFARRRPPDRGPAHFVSLDALMRPDGQLRPDALSIATGERLLVFGWRPGATVEALNAVAEQLKASCPSVLDVLLCPHPAGPPRCWCRPPLPGLVLALAHKHAVSCQDSDVLGTSPAHRTLAETVGAHYG